MSISGFSSNRISFGTPRSRLRAPLPLILWVLFCVVCNFAGWLLSFLHQLNAIGYAIVFAVAIGAGFAWWRKERQWRESSPSPPGRGRNVTRLRTDRGRPFSFASRIPRLKRRFRRPFPLAFLGLAALAFAGGALYAPNNYDALAYRTPRVLHWLAEGRWHWIHTDFQRLNTRGCGIEWVTAPLLVFTRTDRWLFLINAVSFLLLPGSTFAILTRLGVRSRVAWHWMWLYPTGYCFLLQAGSIANDLFGAFFAMAAIELALRARENGRIGYLWLSALAAGLMTASKTFNLLLLPAWFVAAFPVLRLLWSRWFASGLVALLAACVSFLPTALLNLRFCNDWTGQAAEKVSAMRTGAPILHVAVNSVLLLLHNFVPTVFPWADTWNRLMGRLIPPSLANTLAHHFEPAGAKFLLGEMQIEEMAGLGMGLSVLLLTTLIYRLVRAPRVTLAEWLRRCCRYESLVCFAAWAGAGVLVATSGLNCPARYFAPFYVVLLAPILAGSSVAPREALRKTWWRWGAAGTFLLAALLLVVTQARPLWPALTILRTLGAEHSSVPLLSRAYRVYSVYAGRDDAFRAARVVLPPGASPLGLVTFDDPETSLWRPFGSRRVMHICNDDTLGQIHERGIQYALVSSNVLDSSIDDWLSRNRAQQIQELSLELRATKGPTPWYLVRFKD